MKSVSPSSPSRSSSPAATPALGRFQAALRSRSGSYFQNTAFFMICCSFSPRPDKSSASTIRSRTLSFSDVFSAILSARQPPDSSPASKGLVDGSDSRPSFHGCRNLLTAGSHRPCKLLHCRLPPEVRLQLFSRRPDFSRQFL